MGRNAVGPSSFPYAGSLELTCHVVFGDDDHSRVRGVVARSLVHPDVKFILSKRVWKVFRSIASGSVLDLALSAALASPVITLRFLKASRVFMV